MSAAFVQAFNHEMHLRQGATSHTKLKHSMEVGEDGVTRVHVSGTVSGSKSTVDRFIQGVEDYWNGTHNLSDGRTVEFNVDLQHAGRSGGDIHVKTDITPPSSRGLAYISHAELGGSQVTIWMSDPTFGWTSAHEFGHLLGLPNTYDPATQLPYPGHQNDIMGNVGGVVGPDHIRTYMYLRGWGD